MRIVLLGYMGSGKTTVGKTLATDVDIDFIDLDDYIENSEGLSVAEIFASKGEIYFRKKEGEYLKMILSDKDNFVLSTGGGTPCYGDNMNAILEGTANVFYLKVSIKELTERLLKEKEHRPLIKNIADTDLPDFIGKHLFERTLFYERAHHNVYCDNKTSEKITNEIKKLLV
ncbi:shikimate kinase [Maribacter algicola]|uniref:Shikimate kinase n=1 Tax=Meishania litoralis TaxID=3434685 RepID=A0ACC7LEE4_9FLAO